MGVTIVKKSNERRILETILPRKCERANHNLARGLNSAGQVMVRIRSAIAGGSKKSRPLINIISRQIRTIAIPVSFACCCVILFVNISIAHYVSVIIKIMCSKRFQWRIKDAWSRVARNSSESIV
jgi:hypothetical protein